ncbi:GntR family transcriptional regulator [Kitasatospora sp. MAP5-34]|uniref:GntR family transcriptional regulator n=1 Tax=Kitasatospora sp. MAP5-34 TaxID=3035102 RepID=UPI00247696F0|nr:GntR family transcriptional regulator [Kitasatospora sp. MAP5-34]MDH6576205.1 DNA-binding GntR family transcriptional regulator [Kitasatospora sp. MAP5-34]
MGDLGRPAYLRLADALRGDVLSGTREPDSKMPSIADLCREHGLSEQPVRQALRVLTAEGLVEGRPGSGTYVRARPVQVRMARGRDQSDGSPFAAESAARGVDPSWTGSSLKTYATASLAARLGLADGAPILQSQYVFRADGRPVQLATSWEPLAVTDGTDVVLPELGPLAGCGVAERMASIGITVTRVTEDVASRPVLEAEAERLGIPLGSTVLVIERTHRAGELAVETADIVLAAEHFRLSYEIDIPAAAGSQEPPAAPGTQE